MSAENFHTTEWSAPLAQFKQHHRSTIGKKKFFPRSESTEDFLAPKATAIIQQLLGWLLLQTILLLLLLPVLENKMGNGVEVLRKAVWWACVPLAIA